jgi:hypothetical protein
MKMVLLAESLLEISAGLRMVNLKITFLQGSRSRLSKLYSLKAQEVHLQNASRSISNSIKMP